MSLLRTLTFIAAHPLSRGRKARALMEYFKWQIGSRLVPGQVIFDWVDGSRAFVRRGETGMTGNVYCGLHDFADMGYLLHVATSEDLFVDVGANVGSYTILACAVKGARGVSIEPVPSSFARLRDNIRLNNLDGHVTALNVGVSDRESDLQFTSDENCTNHVVSASDAAQGAVISVKTAPLDSLLGDKAATIVKIDVEGFETAVLAGGERTFQSPELHSVIMELNGSGKRYGYSDADLLDRMVRFGFSPHSYDPFSRALSSLEGHANTTGNTLFIKNAALVRQRLLDAERFAVAGSRI
jgi:FkbM family methyltransferase